MSFQEKGLWASKGGGHVNDEDAMFDSSSKMEPKRSLQCFFDTEPAFFPIKKQAVEAPVSKPESGITISNAIPWENSSEFQSVPNQFMDRLFGSEISSHVDLSRRSVSNIGTDAVDMRNKIDSEQFENDSSDGLSISYVMEDQEAGVSYGGLRKVKVNQVKDPVNVLHGSLEHDIGMSTGQTDNHQNEDTFISMLQPYGKEDGNVTLIRNSFDLGDANIRLMGSIFGKGGDNNISMNHSYSKGDTNTISFGGYQDDSIIEALTRPTGSYSLLCEQSSVLTSETRNKKEVNFPNVDPTLTTSQLFKSRLDSTSKNKMDTRPGRKEAPNSFPSNVRSLIATGMLDGVPVRYISVSREELSGTIKGSGYLCGCKSCNFSKALNAYEFERHANCKTKHPNNHIYFENGKTIYQIVQELRSTPESMLFDAVQTVTGSPINQKAFRIWKESFQAATRELQRIYGKEELNL
ncbi:uncharacterized protein LOC142555135 isoform X1 [Primulina tabacum]|uniref:uncharacterized protein LOC142555135 isoform X1 n=1 Tax=Primulina tabacum TaxID=48773 RepID=UPI003F59A63B